MLKPLKVLITGTNGFLGNHLLNYFKKFNYDLFSVTKSTIVNHQQVLVKSFEGDLTNETFVKNTLDAVKPNVIIHCAAMSKPDDCENNQQLCWQTNVLSTKYLVENAQNYKAHVVFCSTDFVYGEGEQHTELDACKPLNYYAKSKLAAEQIIASITQKFTIIRPVFIYGNEIKGVRKSFVQWVKESLENGQKIKVVNDQFRTPTHVIDICKAIENIVASTKLGIFNLAGTEILTPYQMAVIIANQLNLDDKLIIPVTEADFKEPVKRAKRSVLCIEKAKETLGFDPLEFSKAIATCF